jgi:shikimate kinase
MILSGPAAGRKRRLFLKPEEQPNNCWFMPTPNSSIIFLIGYRCTGKTTVARLLAQKLGWDWIDADSVLEARYGKNIRQIFADEGEAGFRDKEEQIFAELCQLQRCVVATGGGAILRDVNRQRMRSAGNVIWLTADAQTIWERFQGDPATAERRPPLTIGGLAEIEEALKIREPVYRACADLIFSTARHSTEEIAQQIADELSRGATGGVWKAQRDESS